MSAVPSVRRGVVIPTLAMLLAFGILMWLGTWQLERKAWKEALIAMLSRRVAAEPVALPAPATWTQLDAAEDEFRRVKFTGEFVPAAEALVYTSGSTLRPDVSGPGYWVFAPVRLADGATLVVNRGFMPEGMQDPKTHLPQSGPLTMVGALRWPEPRGWFTPRDQKLFFARDQIAMAEARGWGPVAPFYVELETPSGAGTQPGRLTVNIRNEHLQYAITWYCLAAMVAGAFAFWVRARWRGLRESPAV